MSAPASKADTPATSPGLRSRDEEKQNEQIAATPRDGPEAKIMSKIEEAVREKRPFYSFEYFPPKTPAGVLNLYARMDRMAMLEPLFMDVTWGAGGSTADLTLELSSNAQSYCKNEVMMHLTCTNILKSEVAAALIKAKKAGIKNILALRGDPPKGQEQWEAVEGGFSHAVDLVKFIRQEHGDYFGIAVAGYPEAHMTAPSLDQDIQYLKEKVDAGADLVITQLFYDVQLFLQFVDKCRAKGITCPIIPGIMPIQNYRGFKRMTTFCKTHVPQEIERALEPIKDDDQQVRAYGVQLGIKMCKELLAAGTPGLHFYTLNLENSTIKILAGLGFVTLDPAAKGFPWQASKLIHRKNEDVRPIFWANRPQSYLTRTNTWDEFPNGRWGDAASPAFGDLTDYHLVGFKTGTKEERRQIWGSPSDLQQVYEVFAKYVRGEVPRLPWCETALHLETHAIKDQLVAMNSAGFLTINSQPRVNGAASDDDAVGWGGPGGYVYQKAYLEFFVAPDNLQRLITECKNHPSLVYHAVNKQGESKTNGSSSSATAVTWGVFPSREIQQPTVVDPASFPFWKDEAFALWKSQWQSIYGDGTPSSQVISRIVDEFYLVNIVDNDYINGDIFSVFRTLCPSS